MRQNVFQNGTGKVVGWFVTDLARQFAEERDWDGTHLLSVHTRDPFDHQALYRTAGGRWVLHCWTQWEGHQPTWQFISAAKARAWLIRNRSDAAVEEFFGALEEETGPAVDEEEPNLGGRPAIGPAFRVKLPAELRTRLEQRAEREREATGASVSLAEMLRRLATSALDQGL